MHLLRRAGLAGTGDGVDWSPAHVTFIDELDWAALAKSGRLELFLVDHNKLPAALVAHGAHVREIVDHHEDEGEYEWVEPGVGGAAGPAARRNVELGIGSCASLVAERLEVKAPALAREPAVAALLLGAVVLDTANLQPKAKAQKAREAAVAQRLLAAAAPSSASRPTRRVAPPSSTSCSRSRPTPPPCCSLRRPTCSARTSRARRCRDRASPSASPPSSSASTRSSRAPTSSPTCEPSPPPAASGCCC